MKKIKEKIKETWEDSPALAILSTAAVISASAYFLRSTAEIINATNQVANSVRWHKHDKAARVYLSKREGDMS